MQRKFSHSSLGTFRNCPRQFKFRYVEKVSVPRKFYAFTHLGNAVHHQLKIAYQWAADDKLYPLDVLLDGFEAAWAGPIREKVIASGEHLTIEDDIEAGRKMLTKFYERYQPFDEGVLLLAEKKIDFDLPNCRSGFTTRQDRVLKRPDGMIEICDYKTGKNLPAGATDQSFRFQMGMYQLAVQEAFPQFKDKIEVAQYFLRHDEVIRDRLREDQLDELAEQFRSEASEIGMAERNDDWPVRESGLCNFCDYAHLCPAKRHRLAIDAEADDDDLPSLQQASELADEFIRVDLQLKKIKAEHDSLKIEVRQAALGLDLAKLSGAEGEVRISVRRSDKLPTKSGDAEAYVAVSMIVRSWDGMETCFKLDDRAVLELYRKGRLTETQVEQLKEYLQPDERVTVAARPNKPTTTDDDAV